MSCPCYKRQPCLIHKDKPLLMPSEVSIAIYVLTFYEKWEGATCRYFTTISKDAISFFTSEVVATKEEAFQQATNKLATLPKP